MQRYDAAGWLDVPWALKLDSAGNVCVTGYCFEVGASYDYVTRRYTPAGLVEW